MPRPTKYSEELLELAENYYIESVEDKEAVPTIEELSIRINISDETINEWGKEKPEFSATVKRIKNLQKQRLQSLGLKQKVNTTMAIFLLKANHGFIETERREHTGRDGEAINASITYMPEPLPDDYYLRNQPNNDSK